jgi:DNA-binding CsgD family transcriptional regulator
MDAEAHNCHQVFRNARFLKQTVALSLIMIGGWVLVQRVMPYFDTLFPLTREVCTIAFGLSSAVIALLGTFKPQLLARRTLTACALGSTVIGATLLVIGISTRSIPLLVLGVSLGRIGISCTEIIASLALMEWSGKALGLCVVSAFILSYIGQGLLSLLPEMVGQLAYVVLPVTALLIFAPFGGPVLERIRTSESPSERLVTKPMSYLPFSHHLFICFFLFRLIYGYTLCFGEIDGAPLATLSTVVPTIIIALLLVLGRKQLNPDILFQASALLIIMGLLLVPIAQSTGLHAAISNILASGVLCFDVMFWYVLIAIAARNENGAIPVLAWGNSVAPFGIVIGAFIGRTTNRFALIDPVLVTLITSGLLLIFIGYAFILLKRFSFNATISNIEPDTAVVMRELTTQILEKRCAEIAAQYNLTPRETEVLSLLARGRSGRYIKDALVVSHNTVKAHVKHIYQKLDIHTHQDLIDIIEA